MKKILQLATAATLMFATVESQAQLATGSIAPDFTLTDINGTSHNLYTYLNAGKTVFIDVSATWCPPCWSYKGSGALEDLWTNHGPTGATGVSSSTTNDVVVLFIEGDGSTNSADLNGTGSNTQGDWVTGVDFPIIDPTGSAVTTFGNNYAIAFFPTIYMICPDRRIKEVGQLSTSALYAEKTTFNCMVATAAADAQMILSTSLNSVMASCDSVTPTFRIGNMGTSALTSATITYQVDGSNQKTINWTGNIATYGNTTVTGTKVGASTAGSHIVTAVVSNPNGVTDPTSANNSTDLSFLKYPAVGGSNISEAFNNSVVPSDWIITSTGDPAYTWAADYNNNTWGPDGTACVVLNWFNISDGIVDIMELPSISLVGKTISSMTFDVAYAQYAASGAGSNDRLQVEVSTNCGTTWTSVYNKAGNALKTVAPIASANGSRGWIPSSGADYRTEAISLNAYANNPNVMVRFKATSNYGNNLFIDNINFSNSALGVEENNAMLANSVSVYPNPITNAANISFELAEANTVSIVMVNTLGQAVVNENLGRMNAGQQNYSLDAASLDNGFYFLNITVGNNVITKKVTINK